MYIHGWQSDEDFPPSTSICSYFASLGYRVITYNYPSVEWSEEAFNTRVDNAFKVIEHFKATNGGLTNDTFVAGYSHGGMIGLRMAVRKPANNSPNNSVIGGAVSIAGTIDEENVAKIDDNTPPFLLFNNYKDDVVSYLGAYNAIQKCKSINKPVEVQFQASPYDGPYQHFLPFSLLSIDGKNIYEVVKSFISS